MSDNVVNFRKAKKQIKRARKDQQAAQNREKFGKSKAERKLDAAKTEKANAHLDGHKLED